MIGLFIGLGIAVLVLVFVLCYVSAKEKEVHERWMTDLWDTEEEDLSRLFNEIWSELHGVDN